MSRPGIRIDRRSSVPIQHQLVHSVRMAILAGDLKPGERLISSRELQAQLGISRNTALNALGQLEAEGYVTSVPAKGVFVAQSLHARIKEAGTVAAEEIPEQFEELIAANLQSDPIAELARIAGDVVPFRPGIPALEEFPVLQLKRGLNTVNWNSDDFDYPDNPAHDRLRAAIAQRLRQTRGVACQMDDVIVVPSTQYALGLIGKVCLRLGGTFAIEDPGFPNVRATALSMQARILPVPVDHEGLDTEFLSRHAAEIVFVTPSHQYPTGSVLSLERRFRLLDWALKSSAWIIEADYDSEFVYKGCPQPSLQGLDESGRVIYLGTFSKSLSPAIRVSYIVVPRLLRNAVTTVHKVQAAYPSFIIQHALADFMEGGFFARHISRMRKIYNRRRNALAAMLRTIPNARLRDSGVGLHFTLEFEGQNDRDVSLRAARKGVIAPALSSYFLGRPTLNGLVLGFAAIPEAVAKIAFKRLAEAL